MIKIELLAISLAVVLGSALTVACDRQSSIGDNMHPVEVTKSSAHEISKHMAFLADDRLEGREAGSRGEMLAALYIASHFKGLGLEPLGGDGVFEQRFSLRSFALDVPSIKVEFVNGNQRMRSVLGEEIFLSPHPEKTSIDVEASTVFAGHGIVAPEFQINDYEGLDVRGKIVVVLGSAPSSIPSAEAAHYSANASKYEAAAKRGAIGVIRIWTPTNEAQVSFSTLSALLARPRMTWLGPNQETGDRSPSIELRMTASVDAAEALFAGTGVRVANLVARGQTTSVAGFELETRISASMTMTSPKLLSSQNVAGFLEGADPELKNEVVVLTAHYDHVGICRPQSAEDRICNGALDNALGTATLMNVASRLVAAGKRPARSILFLAVGAEEKGLLGADYFTNYPTLGDREMVANINMDGGFPFYQFSDVIAFGAEQSTMGEMLTDAIAPIDLAVAPDPFPEQSIFTRSDQYAFVRKGIPALFLYNGFTDESGKNAGRAVWDELLSTHYHAPSDDLSLPIDYGVAASFADVFLRLTKQVANSPKRPMWYESSTFGDLFAPDEPKAISSDEPSTAH